MSYKLGYIADRVGVPSKALQHKALIEHGVIESGIYEDLDACLASLRGLEYKEDAKGDRILDKDGNKIIKQEPDTLVVYTTAILGRNKLNDTFLSVINTKAEGVYSLKSDTLYHCRNNSQGMKELAGAWKELEGVTKQQMGAVGKQKGGRKPDPVWKYKEAITADYNEGVTKKELIETYGKYGKDGTTSLSTINRILEN